MKKILMVVHEMNRGGVENFIMNLYRVIDRDVIQFDFVAHTDKKCDFDEEIEELGGTIYHCPDYRIVNHITYCKWWKDFFVSHPEYKIVHSHLDSSANIHLRIAKKHNRVTIAHSHSISEGFGIRALVKSIIKTGFNGCSDYKFACSSEAARWLYGNKANEATIIKNGIDSIKYVYNEKTRNELRKKWNISEDEIVLGHIGRLDKNKNQTFILDILKELNKLGISSTFVSAGKGEELDSLLNKVEKLGLKEKVLFLGLRNDIPKILQAFDVFVMPSVYEGLGIAAIEAQASGLKCILSDSIPCDTEITDNVEFFSLDESPKMWAEKISEMLTYDRTNTSEKIKKAGYDIMTTAQQLTDFYLGL